ncbi:MAG: hypothetical protein U0610_07365 [bacterium]
MPRSKGAPPFGAQRLLHAKVRERRTAREDPTTRVAQAGDGEALTDKEAAHFCILLLIAGNETTTNLLGNALLALMANLMSS